MKLLFKLKLFFYNLTHKRGFFNVKNIVCFIANEPLPQPLPADEEERLLIAKEYGDNDAYEKLIQHNLRLVVYIARKFESSGMESEDLFSIGSVGLIKAIKTFKLDKNIRLATYASRCIENEILMQLRKFNKIKSTVSLEKPLHTDNEGNELCLEDILPAEGDVLDKEVNQSADKKIIYDILSKLNLREQEIIILRYGLTGEDELTQKEVADKLRISQSYISRLEKKILKEMRKEYDKQML